MRTRCSSKGRRMVSVSPLPSLLSIAISPPCSRTMRRTMSKPRPDPELLVVKYGSKTRLKAFRGHAAAGIGEADGDVRGVHVGPDAQNAAALHRFEAVLDHVVERLLHLVAIEFEQRQIGTQFLLRPRCRDPRFPAAKKRTASSTIVLTFSGWSSGFDGRIAAGIA